MQLSQSWYIVKQPTGNCKIVSSEEASGDDTEITEKWGPFSSKEEAIARRIGLIRTGKCQPM
ncbi:DDE transposase family protein [Plectonema cf. radiosum LEGE 06105]|uniref:DDE transposase family protein n=1 Tax=Plectonema cf. radiosum LEGE 06105 TaxID=945769 RepID=A0A8J7F7C4_9CYAN|nr:DDE transposase family protein [Plectonema radiosum]MBE9216093.1 DDE transposase family protein [Plectonema cf. radiosum LEGE 06105]